LIRLEEKVRLTDGAIATTIVPDRVCGFATVRDHSGRLLLEVKPKVDGADLFRLLCLAHDPGSYFIHRAAELSPSRDSSLVELFVDAYASALRNLIGRSGLRGLHEQQQHNLVLRVKGRVLIPKYLQQIAAGRPQQLPCSFSAHTLDNVVNRILRWALHALLHSSSVPSSRLIQLDRLDSSFAGISLQRMTLADLNRVVRLPEAFRSYFASGALPIASFIIRNLSLAALPGDVDTSALTFPAYEVFEHAFANEAARRYGQLLSDVAQLEWPIQAWKATGQQRMGTFVPDVVLPPTEGCAGLVVDTKWKTCIHEGVATGMSLELQATIQLPGIRLHNADIFQMLAYLEVARQLHGDDHLVGVLVYPVANVNEVDLTPIEVKTGLGVDGKSLSVFLLPWDLGAESSARTDLLWMHLEALRSRRNPSSVSNVRTTRVTLAGP
jgi:5-methylcytosine-specific restriction endonuclease McrBC regulatory subunit McrC